MSVCLFSYPFLYSFCYLGFSKKMQVLYELLPSIITLCCKLLGYTSLLDYYRQVSQEILQINQNYLHSIFPCSCWKLLSQITKQCIIDYLPENNQMKHLCIRRNQVNFLVYGQDSKKNMVRRSAK